MSERRKIETDFFMWAKMAGIQQKKPDLFVVDDITYKVNASVTPQIADAFDGRNRAIRLLRQAHLVEHVCSLPGNEHLFGVVAKSFDEVSQEHPILRSYYEAARVGGRHHAWMRWRRS